MKSLIISAIKKKWILHLAFWGLSIYVIGSYFSISSILKILDFVYSLFFHLCLVPIVYLNLKVLIPRFFEQSQYIAYGLLTILNIGLGLLIHDLVFDLIIPKLDSGFYIVSFTDKVLLIQIFLIYLVITTLMKLSESWFRLQRMEQEKITLELDSLKSQLNPHFLFNGLNSIYSLALNKDEQAAGAVLKLSNLLRYVLYEVGDKMIRVEKELEMIRHYADLQSLRVGKNYTISYESNDGDQETIPPMILLPIIENAYKHGNMSAKDSFLNITIKVTDDQLAFSCENSIGKKDDPHLLSEGGIGIRNIQKRLDLLYGEDYVLKVGEKDDTFTVNLFINLP